MDASPFPWLEDPEKYFSLHRAVDDATGKILGLYFRPQEDLIGYFQVLKQMLTNHGAPQDIYSDRHTIFFSPKRHKLSFEEEMEGKSEALTQFGRALDCLGIGQIPAYSPQAKGRIERLWGTLQHRLVVEMRIAGIKFLEEANAFLPDFIKRYNARFGKPAQEPKSAFLSTPSQKELSRILCLRYERKVSNASTFSWRGQIYPLKDRKGKLVYLKPRSKVYVLESLEKGLKAELDGEIYDSCPFEAKKEASVPLKRQDMPLKRPVTRPSENHPWKKFVFGSRLKTALTPKTAQNLITV